LAIYSKKQVAKIDFSQWGFTVEKLAIYFKNKSSKIDFSECGFPLQIWLFIQKISRQN
jgi:hypothetical protein